MGIKGVRWLTKKETPREMVIKELLGAVEAKIELENIGEDSKVYNKLITLYLEQIKKMDNPSQGT